jgi:hypothetical protein
LGIKGGVQFPPAFLRIYIQAFGNGAGGIPDRGLDFFSLSIFEVKITELYIFMKRQACLRMGRRKGLWYHKVIN